MTILLFVLFFHGQAHADSISNIEKTNKAAKLLQQERPFEASKELIEALESSPLQAETHYDLGLSFEKQGELKKAKQEFLFGARNARDPELRFRALFNAARSEGEQKNTQEALNLYQQALDAKPDSIEAKTNIELLLSQQQGGGGGGDSKKQNQNQDNKQSQNQQQQQQGPAQEPPKKQPQQFKSQDYTQDDVRRILDELKQQEQKVRAKDQEHGKVKEPANGKNW
jgi:Ca-activated chloride channel homolog